jgi:hypothetical protein
MQHLGQARVHAFALACGEDDNTQGHDKIIAQRQ